MDLQQKKSLMNDKVRHPKAVCISDLHFSVSTLDLASSSMILEKKDFYRFLGYINKTDSCWFWEGPKATNGYGLFSCKKVRYGAHRLSYMIYVGIIPSGLVIDHLCRNRDCINPAHLEPVTQRENLLRSPLTLNGIGFAKTHCHKGHIFDVENTYIRAEGKRDCRKCRAEAAKRCREKKAA